MVFAMVFGRGQVCGRKSNDNLKCQSTKTRVGKGAGIYTMVGIGSAMNTDNASVLVGSVDKGTGPD